MRSITTLLLLLAAALAVGSAQAQQATERFIPIGKSPGLSGTGTTVGRIRQVEPEARRITVRGEDASATVTVTGDTRIWQDRSAQGQSNVPGTFGDLQEGRLAEVRPAPEGPAAAWIKVRPE